MFVFDVRSVQADELRRLHATLLVFRKIAAGKRSSDKTAAQLAEVVRARCCPLTGVALEFNACP